MNKRQKEQREAYKKVIRYLKRGYGKRCPTQSWSCCVCQAYMMISYLENQIDLIDWDDAKKYIKKLVSPTKE